jgi:hypothetical protein
MATIATASNELARRPADEVFGSLEELVAHSTNVKNHCVDRTFNIKELRAVADGGTIKIASPSGALARLTHWSGGQLCTSLGAPRGYIRETLSPELGAACLNYGIEHTAPGTDVNLLLRAPNGTPEPIVRACTTDSYGRVWDAELYKAIGDQLAGGRGWDLAPTWEGPKRGAYAGDRDSFLCLVNGGSIVTDPSLASRSGSDGSMFRGLLVRNSEVGASSIVIEQILYRYICGNHMLWGAIVDRVFRRRHVGKGALRDTIREIVAIASKWRDASGDRDQQIIRTLIETGIATTDKGIVDELRALGATAEQAAAIVASTIANEPQLSPASFWGLANGATRVSQETAYQDERYELDRLAGAILARGARKLVAA